MDVLFQEYQEYTLPLSHHNAASNWSLLGSIVINIGRQHGYDSLTKALMISLHNVDKLFSILE